MKKELIGADYLYSVKIGIVLGFLVGWAIGVALLVYLGSDELNNWPGVPSIPIWYGIGFATYGFIVGGSGMFANIGRKPAKPVEKPKGVPIPITRAA
jgi:hypothetical protein